MFRGRLAGTLLAACQGRDAYAIVAKSILIFKLKKYRKIAVSESYHDKHNKARK